MAYPTTETRMRRIERKVKASGARCTCGWNTGDHEPRCELLAAWDEAEDDVDDEDSPEAL